MPCFCRYSARPRFPRLSHESHASAFRRLRDGREDRVHLRGGGLLHPRQEVGREVHRDGDGGVAERASLPPAGAAYDAADVLEEGHLPRCRRDHVAMVDVRLRVDRSEEEAWPVGTIALRRAE